MWPIQNELQYIAQAFYALSYVAIIYIFVRLVLNLRKERKLIEKEIKRLNKMLDPILNSKKAKLKQKARTQASAASYLEENPTKEGPGLGTVEAFASGEKSHK